MNGFVVLDKAEGMTSFFASSIMRKIYHEKKTGHTGTLDPMATGVLPVALGKATRFINCLPASDKSYTARFRCGITTDTLDITGRVLSEQSSDTGADDVLRILPAFRGEIMQTPPMYSAISVNGRRLYELARRGEEIEREQRKITVRSLELTGVYDGEFEITVECSAGTYIRSLIDDIGKVLGCGACMTALRRTRANGFRIEDAHTEEELKILGEKALLPLDRPFEIYPAVTVTEAQTKRFSNGGELDADRLKITPVTGIYRVYSPSEAFLGLGEITEENPLVLNVKKVVGNDG